VIAVEAGAASVGAFFDLDGTVLPAPSLEWRFVGYLLEHDEISGGHVGRWLARFAGSVWRDLHGATVGNKRYLCGVSEGLADEWEQSLAMEYFCGDALGLFEEALQRIVWHGVQGHRVFVVSGTLAPLARVVARRVSTLVCAEIEVCATELEAAPGVARIWNGCIAGEHMSGGAKLRAVAGIAARYGIDLARSYAYGDSFGDLRMLEGVGNSVAVNPTRRLARVARERGWQTCVWEKTFSEIPHVAARRFASRVAQ
jgi:phosphoserine phosphatase